MELRELKKEVQGLPSASQTVASLQQEWLRPIRSNSNPELPSLKDLSEEQRKEINDKLQIWRRLAGDLQSSAVSQKLQHYSRYLIELALTSLRSDGKKAKMITNHLLNDDYLNLSQTITDVQVFENNVKALSQIHKEITELLNGSLSLEEAVLFMDKPHQKHLQQLQDIAEKQKSLVKDIGANLIKLAAEDS
ncbi:hypothetical protein COV20_00655 [Candidatus Woesearchaeota archaeon CG10_big_fil_rev_8_21_14_0_10_45_16]|nr:MAG: hypothetical protein COV20_00655 [Candidatus Woesearchaeota archaeon CG10_big_fil_rev_8_21_14_0_10_45_16]